MDMKKIYTFGDGFAVGHIWPEWPQLLQAVYPDIEVINTSGIGAGNEFLINAVLSKAAIDPVGIYIVQWARPLRFDKLINTHQWDNIIDTDSVYSKNIVNLDNNNWWLSSASTQDEVLHYHNFYIENSQAKLRTYNYMLLLKNYFANNKIQYHYMATYAVDYLTETQKNLLLDANWSWHDSWQGMDEYSRQSKYKNDRQNETQPSPNVQLEWIIECLLHKLPIAPDNQRVTKLKKLISNANWTPFYWDRDAHWKSLLSKL